MIDFDDLIRGKLAAAQHEGLPSWDALAEQLDGEAFDDHLRGALPAAGVATAAMSGAEPDWEGLLDRLDAAVDAEGDAFDRLISRRLAELETDLAPADSWRQLSHRIDTLWPLRRVFVRYRVLEVAAAAALILTFVPLLRDNPIWRRGQVEMVETGRTMGGLVVGAADASPTYSPLGNLTQALGFGSGRGEVASPGEIAALYGTTADGAARGTGAFTAVLQPRFTPPVSSATDALLQGLPTWSPATDEASDVGNPRPLPNLAMEPFAGAQPKLVVDAASAKTKPWGFGASGTYKAWQVFTPTDRSFDRRSSTRGVIAPQISAHALRNLGPRWRIGLGVGMTSATYAAGLPEVLRAGDTQSSKLDLSEDFRSIDLDIAQATLDLRYGLLPHEQKVQVWIKGGVGANAFLRTGYDVRRTLGERNADPALAMAKPGAEEYPARTIEKPFVPSQVKDFSSGLLEGGRPSETVQLFGRLGVEAEIKLGDRLRAFGSVDADYVLPGQRGFGPNKDRFGAVGIEVGARVSL